MGLVTQRVHLDDLADLASQPPRAALAFATDGVAACVPAVVVRDGETIRVGVDPATLPIPRPTRAAVLVDDGRYWFELRAVTWRGTLAAGTGADSDTDTDATSDTHALVWLRLDPERATPGHSCGQIPYVNLDALTEVSAPPSSALGSRTSCLCRDQRTPTAGTARGSGGGGAGG